MITYIENDDIFRSSAQVLVNTVNCKGVMGKGIALEFKRRFPDCHRQYDKTCREGKLKPGGLVYVERNNLFGDKDIVHFATKDHWRGKSRIEWIDMGLANLVRELQNRHISSVAIPTLGCGLGRLKWEDVKPLIEKYFADSGIEVEIYLSAIRISGEI